MDLKLVTNKELYLSKLNDHFQDRGKCYIHILNSFVKNKKIHTRGRFMDYMYSSYFTVISNNDEKEPPLSVIMFSRFGFKC